MVGRPFTVAAGPTRRLRPRGEHGAIVASALDRRRRRSGPRSAVERTGAQPVPEQVGAPASRGSWRAVGAPPSGRPRPDARSPGRRPAASGGARRATPRRPTSRSRPTVGLTGTGFGAGLRLRSGSRDRRPPSSAVTARRGLCRCGLGLRGCSSNGHRLSGGSRTRRRRGGRGSGLSQVPAVVVAGVAAAAVARGSPRWRRGSPRWRRWFAARSRVWLDARGRWFDATLSRRFGALGSGRRQDRRALRSAPTSTWTFHRPGSRAPSAAVTTPGCWPRRGCAPAERSPSPGAGRSRRYPRPARCPAARGSGGCSDEPRPAPRATTP